MATVVKVRKITPVGEAKWAHIHEPKAGFVDPHGNAKGEPKYQIGIAFDPKDPAWNAWGKDMNAKLAALPQQINKATGEKIAHQVLVRRELDREDQPTGRYYVTLKTGAKFKPGLFDRCNKPLPDGTMVGNKSKIRVAYTENTYDAFGGGINLYLDAVQVLELVEFQARGAEAYGFAAEEAPAEDIAPF